MTVRVIHGHFFENYYLTKRLFSAKFDKTMYFHKHRYIYIKFKDHDTVSQTFETFSPTSVPKMSSIPF